MIFRIAYQVFWAILIAHFSSKLHQYLYPYVYMGPLVREHVSFFHMMIIFLEENHMFWLHIPKTGTSFVNTIFHWGCSKLPLGTVAQVKTSPPPFIFPEAPCEITFLDTPGKHTPQIARYINITVAMFREPRKRIVSAFYHSHGPVVNDGMPLTKQAELRYLMQSADNEIEALNMYSRFPGVSNCQLNMVLGYRCGSHVEITKLHLKEAMSRVDSFLFVGITEEWNRSICLFHKMHGGQPRKVQFQNANPGHYDKSKKREEFVLDENDLDAKFYKYIRNLVEKRFHIYGC